jgi:hypothetical protein
MFSTFNILIYCSIIIFPIVYCYITDLSLTPVITEKNLFFFVVWYFVYVFILAMGYILYYL